MRAGSARADWTIVAVFAGRPSLPAVARALRAPAREALRDALRAPGFEAEAGEVVPAGSRQLLVGLGKKEDLRSTTLRAVGAKLARRLDRLAVRSAALLFEESFASPGLDAETAGRCLAEGMGLANWRVDFFAGAASKNKKARAGLTLTSRSQPFLRGVRRGLTLAECTNYARRLAATPPNICHPGFIASECRRLAREARLRVRVIGYAQARQLGMGGLVNVGRGSAHKPCLVVLEHRPARIAAAARGVRLALVGKTMTYDTGGYSLKVNNGMKGMKYDKNGGMAVLGAMRAIAALKVPVHVFALLPTAENMVGGDSYRPDDIITLHNGVSVEVTNTDAEGRLVLADALAYACRRLTPSAVVDAATLTGGVVVALGSWCAGLWCNDERLCQRIEAAADATDERVWRMPLWSEHRDFMRAKHADIWNSGPNRDGHPIQGAAFLSYFVDEKIPWAHIDIAGVSSVDSDRDLHVQGPTGYGVRLLTELAESFARR
jgi:leucyl aminopeptidase